MRRRLRCAASASRPASRRSNGCSGASASPASSDCFRRPTGTSSSWDTSARCSPRMSNEFASKEESMDTKLMMETARAMVAPGKGLLAADESAGTCKKRFDTVNVECNEENRRAYREMLFTTPGIPEYVSGVILFDETLRQKTKDGVNFGEYLKKNGIIPGIKVDAGAHDMALHPGEKVSEGLDKLAERMKEYFSLGERFAKWRAVITIGEGIPSQ